MQRIVLSKRCKANSAWMIVMRNYARTAQEIHYLGHGTIATMLLCVIALHNKSHTFAFYPTTDAQLAKNKYTTSAGTSKNKKNVINSASVRVLTL